MKRCVLPEGGCFDLSCNCQTNAHYHPRLRDSSTRWVPFHPSDQGLVAVPECPQNGARNALPSVCRFAKTAAGCELTGTKSANLAANFRDAKEKIPHGQSVSCG